MCCKGHTAAGIDSLYRFKRASMSHVMMLTNHSYAFVCFKDFTKDLVLYSWARRFSLNFEVSSPEMDSKFQYCQLKVWKTFVKVLERNYPKDSEFWRTKYSITPGVLKCFFYVFLEFVVFFCTHELDSIFTKPRVFKMV